MKYKKIPGTKSTPEIDINPDEGNIKITGRSIPENPDDFYNNLIILLKEYFKNAKSKTTIDFYLEYVNSGSSKYIVEILQMLDKISEESITQCEINWYYEEDDEAIYDLGEHFRSMVKFPFNLIEYL